MKYGMNSRFSVHTVRVTFMVDDKSHSRTVEINGNCKGFSILESAKEKVIDQVWDDVESVKGFTLFDDKGGTLLMDESSFGGNPIDMELEKLIVSVEIVGVVPEKKK